MTSPATIVVRLDRLDWRDIVDQVDAEGYAVLPDLIGAGDARQLARRLTTQQPAPLAPLHAADAHCADLAYLDATLPAPLAGWPSAFYPHLVGIADRWNERLGIASRYPAAFDAYRQLNERVGQTCSQSHWHRLAAGSFLPLHRHDEGEHVFPLQIVVLLAEPGVDFAGGEFVMTEQRPRMQSRAMVLPLALGDAAIVATAERPFKGATGEYRVKLKQAISRVRSGERIGVGLTFHQASPGHPRI